MEKLSPSFWKERYQTQQTQWDIGNVSTPLKEYFDQLENKDLKILIPGGGNAYEAEYLFKNGFQNVFVVDVVDIPLQNLKKRMPEFPENQLLHQNFFDLEDTFDLIVEQTFFCAIDTKLRQDYAQKSYELLKPKGKLMGLLWDNVFLNREDPPYGGTREEYKTYFDKYFEFKHFESAHNSIQPRQGTELFILLEKK